MKKYIKVFIFGRFRKKDVEALPIKVRGFEFLDLFVHRYDQSWFLLRGTDLKNLELLSCPKGKYMVSDGKSGTYLVAGCDSEEEAYFKVKSLLETEGPQRVKELIKTLAL